MDRDLGAGGEGGGAALCQGMLVIPMWQGSFAQIVPGQAAVAKLSIVVPQVPATAQAWEVSPGDVGLRWIGWRRG